MNITLATTDDDIRQILDLQKKNLKTNFEADSLPKDGFVSVDHSFELLKSMNDAAPHIIAKDGETHAGYALTMLEVSEMNPRSIRAHGRVGFKTVHTYQNATDCWRVMVWDFAQTLRA